MIFPPHRNLIPWDGHAGRETLPLGGATGTQAPLSLEFAVDGVTVGAAAIGERMKTVLGVEGAEELKESAFSPDNLTVSLAPTDDGRVRATVTRRDDSGATGSSPDSFFLRVKVK